MNAFVITPNIALRSSSFTGRHVQNKVSPVTAKFRMTAEKKESEFSNVGEGSMWKESYFTGGFPGGEQFYQAWIDDGMTKDVPDIPESMQSKNQFKPKKEEKGGILGMLDSTEFFKGFDKPAEPEDQPDDDETEVVETQDPLDDSPVPDESLYEAYFPASRRNIAPHIEMIYEKDYYKDRVSLAMKQVTASPTDVYFPKETKNKAPVIDIKYYGSVSSASVTVSLDYIEGLPALATPPKTGEARANLVPGRGGGLKLEYSVAGEGSVNI